MKDKVSIEQVIVVGDEIKDFLSSCWTPKNGDSMTDGEIEYIFYENNALPLNGELPIPFSESSYLPLLSIGQICSMMKESFEFGENAVDLGTTNEFNMPYPLDDESIDRLWDAFLTYAEEEIKYLESVNKLGHMLIHTISSYLIDGELSEELYKGEYFDDELIDSIIKEQFGEEYPTLLNFLNNELLRDDYWDEAWDIFYEHHNCE